MALVLTACAGSASNPESTQSNAPRPASTARLEIAEPASGSTIAGGTVKVRLTLEGARMVTEATKDLKPDEGHIHLIMDDKWQSMTFGLEDEIPLEPGTHLLLAELVAGDHAPFNPRVVVTGTFLVPPT